MIDIQVKNLVKFFTIGENLLDVLRQFENVSAEIDRIAKSRAGLDP